MYLKDLIEALKAVDPERVLKVGFNGAHSYRGYYDQLAFEPAENVTVGEMLATAEGALNQTFRGYKGGDFVMHEYVDVNLAYYGRTGEELGRLLLSYMLKDIA